MTTPRQIGPGAKDAKKIREMKFRLHLLHPVDQPRPVQEDFHLDFLFFRVRRFRVFRVFRGSSLFECPEGDYENDERHERNLICFRPQAGLGFIRVQSVAEF